MGDKVNSLRLMKLLHTSDLELVSPAWTNVAQLGRLEPKEEKDHDAFGALIHYMNPRQLVRPPSGDASLAQLDWLTERMVRSDDLCAIIPLEL